MGVNWKDAAKRMAQSRVDQYIDEANDRARTRAQHDMNDEGVKYIAARTGHNNLAAACFFEYDINDTRMRVEIVPDGSVLDGYYKSRSSYHQGGGKWSSVSENYGISRSEFWDGIRAEPRDAGTPSGDWIMENFWLGIVYITNGWPLAKNAEYLSVTEARTIAAQDVAQEYLDNYNSSGRYQAYVAEELNVLLR